MRFMLADKERNNVVVDKSVRVYREVGRERMR